MAEQQEVTVIYNITEWNEVGLFAYLIRVLITMYDIYPGKVYIDWSCGNAYQNSGESKNIWDLLYKQPDIDDLNATYLISKRIACPSDKIIDAHSGSVGKIRDNFLQDAMVYPTMEHRKSAKKLLDEKFILVDSIADEIDAFFQENIYGKRCLAVHRRGCLYYHNNTVTDDNFNAGLLEVLKTNEYDSVFLCSDNYKSKHNLTNFIQQHGIEVITYNSYLSNNLESKMPFLTEQVPVDRNLLAKEVLIETYLMSMCRGLYKSASGVTTFALYLNPDLIEHTMDRTLEYH